MSRRAIGGAFLGGVLALVLAPAAWATQAPVVPAPVMGDPARRDVRVPGSVPNISGMWISLQSNRTIAPVDGSATPFLPWAQAYFDRRAAAEATGTPLFDPNASCLPSGVPRAISIPYSIEIVQTPKRMTILHEVAHNVRRFYIGGKHPKNPGHTFLGHSVAHWEGDTLVVDTVGLNDRTFIDDEGDAHSDQERIVERYRKIDGGKNLEMVITVIDPVTLEHPYSYYRIYHWRPDIRRTEYVCEENNRNAPVNGVTVAQ